MVSPVLPVCKICFLITPHHSSWSHLAVWFLWRCLLLLKNVKKWPKTKGFRPWHIFAKYVFFVETFNARVLIITHLLLKIKRWEERWHARLTKLLVFHNFYLEVLIRTTIVVRIRNYPHHSCGADKKLSAPQYYQWFGFAEPLNFQTSNTTWRSMGSVDWIISDILLYGQEFSHWMPVFWWEFQFGKI